MNKLEDEDQYNLLYSSIKYLSTFLLKTDTLVQILKYICTKFKYQVPESK
jgi:hypothetical protein